MCGMVFRFPSLISNRFVIDRCWAGARRILVSSVATALIALRQSSEIRTRSSLTKRQKPAFADESDEVCRIRFSTLRTVVCVPVRLRDLWAASDIAQGPTTL